MTRETALLKAYLLQQRIDRMELEGSSAAAIASEKAELSLLLASLGDQ